VEGGSVTAEAAAAAWLNAVLRETSLALAWPVTDPDLREGLASDWVTANRGQPRVAAARDPQAVVDELVSLQRHDPQLWEEFNLWQIAEIRQTLSAVDLDRWRWVTDLRPIGVDLEAALFIDPGPLGKRGQPLRPLEPGEAPAVAFLMHYVDGSWLVSAVEAPVASPT
jgi:hypothetical protein